MDGVFAALLVGLGGIAVHDIEQPQHNPQQDVFAVECTERVADLDILGHLR